jgi:ABC-type multidrug transport system fused ATPase/permease subunit
MAVEIGALRALLSLDSAAFEKGVKRAQASMGNFQRSMDKTARRMKSVGRKLTASVTAPLAIGAAGLVTSATRAAVEIERMAEVSNTTALEFQRFAAGAKTVGLESDKMADIFKDVNDRVGDFIATGGGPMADFFENIAPKVGVTAEQFAKLSGPQALQLYVSSLEKAGVSQQEMTFYMEAMASDATALLPLLRGNGAEMERLGDKAERLGAIMSDDTIASLNNANGSFRDLMSSATAIRNQFVAALAPTLERVAQIAADLAQRFSGLSPEMRRFVGIGAAVAAAIGPLAVALGFVATGIAALASPIGLAVMAFGAVVGAAAAVAANWDDLTDKFPILEVGMQTVARVFDAAWAGIRDTMVGVANIAKSSVDVIVGLLTGNLSRVVEGLTGMWDGWRDATRAAMDAVLGIIEAIVPGFKQAVNDIIASVSALPQRLKEWGVRAVTAFVDGIKETWRNLKKSVTSIFTISDLDGSQMQAALDDVARRSAEATMAGRGIGRDFDQGLIEGVRSYLSDVEGAGADAAKAAEDGARNESQTRSPSRKWMELGRDLMDGLGIGLADRAQSAAQAAASAAKNVTAGAAAELDAGLGAGLSGVDTYFDRIADSIAGVIVQGRSLRDSLRQVFQQIAADWLSSGISRMLQGLVGVLPGGGLGGLVSGLFGGFRADGGDVSSGRSYIVGERGPELFTPRGAGRIVPNEALAAGGGGVARLEVVVSPTGEFDARVQQISGQTAVSVFGEGMRAQGQSQRRSSFA